MIGKGRAARRNEARRNKMKFPWVGVTAKPAKPRPVKEVREHITMDFTGPGGLVRAFINYRLGTRFDKKPKRGWAAQWRARPFQTYLTGDRLQKALLRHQWYRRLRAKLIAEALP